MRQSCFWHLSIPFLDLFPGPSDSQGQLMPKRCSYIHGVAILSVILWHKLPRDKVSEEVYGRTGAKVKVHGANLWVSALILVDLDLDHLRCRGSQISWSSPQRATLGTRKTQGWCSQVPQHGWMAWAVIWPPRGMLASFASGQWLNHPSSPTLMPRGRCLRNKLRNHRTSPATPLPERLFLICSLQVRY